MFILIDVGGTKTRIGVGRNEDTIAPPVVFSTHKQFDTWLAEVQTVMKNLCNDPSLRGVIIGIPGTFTKDGVIIKTPNLPLWQGVPIRHHLEKLCRCEIHLYNDTALVGLGEAVYGAGKGHSIVSYLTISTGVNGVRIVDGAIDRNTFGFEIGHSIIDIEHDRDVESLISGGSLEREFGKPSHEVHDVMLWEKISRRAGIFGANTAMYWSPSMIIYGGPVMNDLHLEIIEKEAKRHLTMFTEQPLFVRGTLKDYGGLYGALAISRKM
ncbi:MAG: hypothetical protein RI935_145 [Candidatus Parcubacteria bacterium]|jgi:glucokinase